MNYPRHDLGEVPFLYLGEQGGWIGSFYQRRRYASTPAFAIIGGPDGCDEVGAAKTKELRLTHLGVLPFDCSDVDLHGELSTEARRGLLRHDNAG